MSLGYASKGVAGAGLGLGIAGTTLGVLNSGGMLGGLFGRNNNADKNWYGNVCCEPLATQSEVRDLFAYQNQLSLKESELAKAQSEIEMHKANEVVNQKISDTYQNLIGIIRQQDKELETQIRALEARQNQTDVNMQRVSDGLDRVFDSLNQKIDCCCKSMDAAIQLEAERRCCNDNAIISYVNATFQPNVVNRMTVTGGTIGVATQSEATFNPLAKCGCNCSTSPQTVTAPAAATA